MSNENATEIKWMADVDEHDFPAAESYLGLIYEPGHVADILARLHEGGISRFKAKDIFRASQLSLLGISNSRVEKDRKKIVNGIALSPLLLVRDAIHGKLVIADGYHRLCAVYGFNEDVWIPCRIA